MVCNTANPFQERSVHCAVLGKWGYAVGIPVQTLHQSRKVTAGFQLSVLHRAGHSQGLIETFLPGVKGNSIIPQKLDEMEGT